MQGSMTECVECMSNQTPKGNKKSNQTSQSPKAKIKKVIRASFFDELDSK